VHGLALLAAVLGVLLFAVPSAAAPAPAARTDCNRILPPGGDLQRFVDALRPGQTGCLRPGAHPIPVNFVVRRSGRHDARITLTSLIPSNPALIRGRFWVSRTGNWWTFTHLRFDGRNEKNLPSPTVNGDASVWRHVEVTNHRSGHAADNGNGICFLLGSTRGFGIAVDTVIERSLIRDCGVASNHNHGIYVEATRGRTVIRDNVIVRSGDRAIQLYPDGDDVLVENNVLFANGSGVIFSGSGSASSDRVLVRRNVIAASVGRWNVESYYGGATPGQGNVLTGNCLWATNPAKGGYYRQRGGVADELGFRSINNRVGRPLFRHVARNDYRIRPGTPCAGTGPRVRRVGPGGS
jgi:hypothetical protein